MITIILLTLNNYNINYYVTRYLIFKAQMQLNDGKPKNIKTRYDP